MNKDVIYIDVEDDITAVIGKVKGSKEKIVALVPPKRIGPLQSAVNLRILQRTAKTAGKHLVLITNDQTLLPLAAQAGLPVAKNLQSKPEIPVVAALKVDDDDDIIDGAQLPIGDHAATAPARKHKIPVSEGAKRSTASAAISEIEASEQGDVAETSAPRPARKGQKVPNFNTFRKRLIIGGVALVAFIAFLVWAIVYAPHATVVVLAKTSEQPVNTSVTLSADQPTNASKGIIKSIVKQEKQEKKVSFDATGTQDQGEAASGSLTLTNSTGSAITVPVGSGFSNGSCTFVTREQVKVNGLTPDYGSYTFVPGTATVKVQATAIGEQCNLAAGSYDSTVDKIKAKGGDMTGGVKKTVKIVTQGDVQRAAEQLAGQKDDDMKTKLKTELGGNVFVVDSSFTTTKADPVAAPQVGKEAPDGKATLTATVTYSMVGIANTDLGSYLQDTMKSTLAKSEDQRVYDDGASTVQLSDFVANASGGTASLTATGQVGPQIKDGELKSRVQGKNLGTIQSDLKSIPGVNDVDVKFSPFWVSTVPKDNSKISIEFKINKSASK